MKNLLFIILTLLSGSALAENSSGELHPSVVANGLRDCHFYWVRYERQGWYPDNVLYIVRCPSSDVSLSYKQGKTDTNVSVEEIARQAALNKLSPTERQLLGLEK